MFRIQGLISNNIFILCFIIGKISYMDSVDLKCETNTNVTARVRAVSILDGVEVVGDWSPEGSFNCYGRVY